MKYIAYIVAFTILWGVLYTPSISAYELDSHKSASAKLASINQDNKSILKDADLKKAVIKKMLTRYGAPLQESADAFITTCVKYELDCYLLPSISGLESGFGKFIYPNSYNPFGWGGGHIVFDNWSESIETVGKGLKDNYINKGAVTTAQIARIYAPPSTSWALKVDFFMRSFYTEEEKLRNTKLNI